MVAREADTLRAQLAQLQVQQAQAETDIKGFMLAATGAQSCHAPRRSDPPLKSCRRVPELAEH